MKQCRVILTLCFALFLLFSCQKKAVPEISSRKIEPLTPKSLPANFVPDTVAGKSLFAGRCGRCHGLPDIPLYSSKRWDIILGSMLNRAQLSMEQGAHVTAYIKQNCPN